jgi:hypothetical protein
MTVAMSRSAGSQALAVATDPSALREILVVYTNDDDSAALERGVALAARHGARLTVTVPLQRLSLLASFAGDEAFITADGEIAIPNFEQAAHATARDLAHRVPPNILLVLRCLGAESERGLRRELVHHRYDICICGPWRKNTATIRRDAGARICVAARRSGTPFIRIGGDTHLAVSASNA